jgi:hypothetical protein
MPTSGRDNEGFPGFPTANGQTATVTADRVKESRPAKCGEDLMEARNELKRETRPTVPEGNHRSSLPSRRPGL